MLVNYEWTPTGSMPHNGNTLNRLEKYNWDQGGEAGMIIGVTHQTPAFWGSQTDSSTSFSPSSENRCSGMPIG